MASSSLVEIADRQSRKRPLVVAAAALVFLIVQVLVHPFPADSAAAARTTSIDWWAVNAVALLLVLATGGGLLCRPQVRALVNDEVARVNYRTAVVAGYWVAMATAMGLYAIPGLQTLTAHQAIYLVVTSSLVVALLTFAGLERRAHRDA